MTKTIQTYWNPLKPEHKDQWQPIEDMEGLAEELTLSIDDETGEYTRLTRFQPDANTTSFGSKSHEYPEEIFVVSGRLYDQAFDMWLEAGHYASRPPGEVLDLMYRLNIFICCPISAIFMCGKCLVLEQNLNALSCYFLTCLNQTEPVV